jgi:hypothetical protein
MNGPQHYREAERLLALIPEGSSPGLVASVHATLAQAAALADLVGGMDDAMEARKAWTEVTR